MTVSVALISPPATETGPTLLPGGTGKPAGSRPGSPATGAGGLVNAAWLRVVAAGARVAGVLAPALGGAGAAVPLSLLQPASASLAAASAPAATAVREVIGGPFGAAVARSNRCAPTGRRPGANSAGSGTGRAGR